MMSAVPMTHGLIVAALMFVLGFAGVMLRRNLMFMLMSLEIMMNAAALAFVTAGSAHLQPDGQVMFIMVLTVAAAEACIGLAIVLQFFHRFQHLDVDAASEMRG